MKSLIDFFIIIFSLKGSWNWACRQMSQNHIVTIKSDGTARKFRISEEGVIMHTFTDFIHYPIAKWRVAVLCISDFKRTDWCIWVAPPPEHFNCRCNIKEEISNVT